MRVLCLLALIGATLSGCCSTHRAWREGFDSCVPQCDSCHSHSRNCNKRSGLFSPCSDSCGGECGSGCDGCASGGGFETYSSGDQGQTVYDGSAYSSMPQSMTCPSCQQTHQIQMAPTPAPSSSGPPPTPPAARENPMQETAEPHQARLLQPMSMPPGRMAPQQMQPMTMQPLQVVPQLTQPVRYQEWQPHSSPPQQQYRPQTNQPQSESLVPYTPPVSAVPPQAQSAVQPVLWVPAQSPAPLLMPAR